MKFFFQTIEFLLFPPATAKIFNVANAKVLVFIPPAVEAGEPQSTLKRL